MSNTTIFTLILGNTLIYILRKMVSEHRYWAISGVIFLAPLLCAVSHMTDRQMAKTKQQSEIHGSEVHVCSGERVIWRSRAQRSSIPKKIWWRQKDGKQRADKSIKALNGSLVSRRPELLHNHTLIRQFQKFKSVLHVWVQTRCPPSRANSTCLKTNSFSLFLKLILSDYGAQLFQPCVTIPDAEPSHKTGNSR